MRKEERKLEKDKLKEEYQELKADNLYYLFKHGDYSGVRDFSRKEREKFNEKKDNFYGVKATKNAKYDFPSHVTITKLFNKYIIGYESKQGKEQNNKMELSKENLNI